MGKTKKVTITLTKETIERLNLYAKSNSINKSALINRLINNELDNKN
jgi:predicted DNA-binding protein